MNKITLIDKAFFLKRIAPFHALDLDMLFAIADKLQLISFEAGQPIFSKGEEAHWMFFIMKGEVAIQDEKQHLLATLHPDDFLGDEAIFSEKLRAYTATSKGDTVLFALSKTNLLTIISECPSIAVGLLQAYTNTTPFRQRQ